MSANLHPIFAGWCNAVSGDTLRAANEPLPLQPFTVQVKDGSRVILSFPAMATSKVAAQRAHEGLCIEGEQCVAYTPEEMEAARRRENEAISAHHFDEYEAGLDDVETMDDGEGQ